ncbi:MAG: hypothetical protein M5R38_04825 [Candidatus Methylomirabilis sp.]|nr:hypothetical protein [Candidatus Methylomirabilis sp.]
MKATREYDRRTFLFWGMGASLLLLLREATASETAVVRLRIDGMT